MPYDRDEVLARTDLGALADELLGARRGRGRSATWACPDAGHGPQTGRTPPVSVFVPVGGVERWRCHGCGAGGTAADLVMTTQGVGFGEALALLAGRAGVGGRDDRLEPLHRRVVEPRPLAEPTIQVGVIEDHVAACEAQLWSAAGAPMRRWLGLRGLGDEVLRSNRVGADPGPRSLPRPPGLPRSGPAVILPVLDADGSAVYLQARYLYPPGGRKYDNPSAALAGPSPRLADVRLSAPPVDPATVLVCEGLPDALIAAQAGHRATALLGAGLPDNRVVGSLIARFATERLVISLDADDRGQAGSARLVELLDVAGAGHRVAVLDVPPSWGDLNGWHLAVGAPFGAELASAVDRAYPVPALRAPAPAPEGLAEHLEAIRYRHVLVDDPVLAVRNLARLRRVVSQWERSGVDPGSLGRLGPRSPIEQDLETLAYRHLMCDDADQAQPGIAVVKAAVAEWSSGLGHAGSEGHRSLALRQTGPGLALPTAAPAHERSLGIDL